MCCEAHVHLALTGTSAGPNIERLGWRFSNYHRPRLASVIPDHRLGGDGWPPRSMVVGSAGPRPLLVGVTPPDTLGPGDGQVQEVGGLDAADPTAGAAGIEGAKACWKAKCRRWAQLRRSGTSGAVPKGAHAHRAKS